MGKVVARRVHEAVVPDLDLEADSIEQATITSVRALRNAAETISRLQGACPLFVMDVWVKEVVQVACSLRRPPSETAGASPLPNGVSLPARLEGVIAGRTFPLRAPSREPDHVTVFPLRRANHEGVAARKSSAGFD